MPHFEISRCHAVFETTTVVGHGGTCPCLEHWTMSFGTLNLGQGTWGDWSLQVLFISVAPEACTRMFSYLSFKAVIAPWDPKLLQY